MERRRNRRNERVDSLKRDKKYEMDEEMAFVEPESEAEFSQRFDQAEKEMLSGDVYDVDDFLKMMDEDLTKLHNSIMERKRHESKNFKTSKTRRKKD